MKRRSLSWKTWYISLRFILNSIYAFVCKCNPLCQVLSLEGTISSLQTERDRLGREVSETSARVEVMERDERDLAEEHTALRSSFRSLSSAYERERAHSEELSAELLALAHTHDTLLQERERTHRHTLEVERVRALLGRASQNRIRVRDLHSHARCGPPYPWCYALVK